MKTTETGVPVESAGFEDCSTEKQRLLDVPPRISFAEEEPWWVTAIGVLVAAGFFVALLILL